MNKKYPTNLLLSPLFLIGLLLLLANDLYLKYEFHNWVTGKLSDFVGLFVFPFFLSILFPKRTQLVYLITAIIFIYWSSELSQALIDFSNTKGIRLNRVIDYSDFIALVVLPFSYFYYHDKVKCKKRTRKLLRIAISISTVFSFIATTLPKYYVDHSIDTDRTFNLPIGKTELLKSISKEYKFPDSLTVDKDSIFYIFFNVSEYRSRLTGITKIVEIDPYNIQITLDSINSSSVIGGFFKGANQKHIKQLNSLTKEEFEELFSKNVIEKIKNGDVNSSIGYVSKTNMNIYQR